MNLAIVLLILQYLLTLSSVSCEGKEYECGEHGRFEYCIDEIPGCIIGCHCHPGYYFDTDTKICEPNSKLIEHHRRSNEAWPKPYQIVEPIITTTSKVDGEVDGISKDAEGLGDWLYNQFFKTIENQVVNETNGKNIITRRSNLDDVGEKKVKRKKMVKKRRGGKQKRTKTNKRKKLLRITENDSLFDITASSSDSKSASSDSSHSSFEYNRYRDDSDEHGHKKIVMIKKKPRRPLPNFIFLPNMETPFYPPIGLPPPPIPAPMYPMVPVPPLIPFFSDDSDEKTTASPNITTTKATTTESTANEEESQISTTTTKSTTKTTYEPATDKVKALRQPSKKRRKQADINNHSFDVSPNRQQFLQYLKRKMKNNSPKFFKPPTHIDKNLPDVQESNFESPYPDNAIHDNPYANNNFKENQDEAESENVDFKYLTELIHRVDINKSNDLPPIEYNPLDSLEVYQPPKEHYSEYINPPNTPDTRRFARHKHVQSDESYYTHLGRQIASMIRNVDTQNKEVNIKLEAAKDTPRNDVYFNVNSPRSYWERSVRSPLTFLKSNKKRFEYLKRSNELLFDIENKVEIVASTSPTLTLREIENIIKRMERPEAGIKIKNNKRKNIKSPKHPINNFNINLWPNGVVDTKHAERISKQLLPRQNINEILERHEIPNDKIQINTPKNIQSLKMLQINRLAVHQKIHDKTNFQPSEKITNIKPFFANEPRNYNKWPVYERLKIPAKTEILDQNFRRLMDQQLNPLFLNRRRYFGQHLDNNYVGNLNKNFLSVKPQINSGKIQPSYFQNEINLIDYYQ